MKTKIARAKSRSPWKNLCARLTLAAFVAALLGQAALAQVADRAAPVATPAAGFALSGAISSAFSAPSIINPAALANGTVFNAALGAPARAASSAPQAAALPAMPAASAEIQAAVLPASAASPAETPTAGASLRSMSDRSAALIAPGAAASDARSLSAAAFDGSAPALSGAATLPAAVDGPATPVFRTPDGRTFRLVPGTPNIVTDENGEYHQLIPTRNGGIALAPLHAPVPSRRPAPAPPKEESGLTDELLNKLVGALQIIDQSFVDKLSPEKWRELIDKGLTEITKGLDEHNTEYYDQEGWTKFRHHLDGNFSGIGVTTDFKREQEAFKKIFEEEKAKAGGVLDDEAEGKIAEKIPFNVDADGVPIKTVHKGSPAEKAGFKSGDVIQSVDGKAVAGIPIKDVTGLIQGKAGTMVKITVTRDGKIMEFSPVRAEMDLPLLTTRMVAPEIGYIQYSEYRSHSEKEFVAALRGLQEKGAKKLIIDLRGNPGGSLETANNILANLLPEGSGISSTRHRGEVVTEARADQDGPFAHMEKIVLVDGHSASASELTATTLQDYGVTIVGPSRSFGKYSFQSVMSVPPGQNPADADAGLRITAGRYYSGKGRSFPGQYDPKTHSNVPGSGGVTPDVIVPMTKEQESAVHVAIQQRLYGEDPKPVSDPVLDKAIEILRGRP
jgi:carboxyl-terminal processing protease